VAVNNRQHVSVCVVSVAYRAFGGGVACNSSHGVIEQLPCLNARVGDLLSDIQLVVLIALSAARNSGLGNQPAHVVVGVVSSAAERTGEAGYVAKQVVGCRAGTVCRVTDSGIPSAGVICELGAVVERIGDAFNLAERVVGIGGCLTHGICDGEGLVEAVVYRFTDDVILGICGLDNVAVAVVGGGEYVAASISDGGFSAKRVVAVLNNVVQRVLDRHTLIQTIICVGSNVIQRVLDREQIVVLVVGVDGYVVLGVGCGESVSVGVVGIGLGVAKRVGLGQEIACRGIYVNGSTCNGIDDLRCLRHGVILIRGYVSRVIRDGKGMPKNSTLESFQSSVEKIIS